MTFAWIAGTPVTIAALLIPTTAQSIPIRATVRSISPNGPL